MKKGTKVKVKLQKGNYHIGEFLGVDKLGNHKVGVTQTSIPGVSKKPGNKYISIFNTTAKKLEVL